MTFDGKLSWIVGLYYSREDIDRQNRRPRRLTISRNISPSTSAAQWNTDAVRSSAAGFGQATLALSEAVDLTVGLRYTYEDIELSNQVSNPLADETWITSLSPALEVYGPTDDKESWNEPTGQIALDWAVTEDAMLYALYSRGFKSGGFQGNAPNELAARIPFDPEFADNYEIGLKSTLLDNTLRLNFSYFQMDFEDLQLVERINLIPGDPTSAVGLVANAATADIKGTEFEVLWATPIDGLEVSLAGGTLDTEIGKSINTLNEGRDLPHAPEYSGTLALSYATALSGQTDMEFRLAYRHTDDFWWDLANKEPGFEEGYGLVDASVNFRNGPWSLGFWGKNLADKEYRSYTLSILQDEPGGVLSNKGGSAVSRIGAPRTWGMTLSYDLDW